jgi:hypothetical protein
MFALTAQAVGLINGSMFAQRPGSGPSEVIEWRGPDTAAYLLAYRRRAHKTRVVPVLDRSLYTIEYHRGEGCTCSVHPVIHDTSMSFVLAYDDIAIGLVGFEYEQGDRGLLLEVCQIQGTRYRTRHSDRETGAEGPARSLTWQPALLNMVVAYAELVGATEVAVRSHSSNQYRAIEEDRLGNARRLYDGTAQDCGFDYDVERKSWTRTSTVAREGPRSSARMTRG